ncbi:BTB/POZ domain-containing protein 9-like [Adelges cooleyi]|uniref:BTB/POZ domain-containing protein 9-like n=1 Tax=Adelges cooleyi TaxID=133065 RepID=UPI00218099E3|nr:BTB/POZ domain-containing protein 9-like [Adelges cooleyi]
MAKQNSIDEINHTCFLLSDISNLYLNDSFSDIVLVVGEERLHAHRVILASRSSYFRVLLYGDFYESDKAEVDVSDVSMASFKILLKYIYTGRMNLSVLKNNTILELFSISDFYGFPNLQQILSEYLHRNINVHNACSLFVGACLYQYNKLKDESLDFIENHALEVLQSEDFLSLTSEALQDILIRDSFYANELDIFRAVCRWIKKHQNDLDHDTEMKALSAIRYPLMSTKELAEIRQSPLVKSNKSLDDIIFRKAWSPDKLQYRGQLKRNVNLFYHYRTVLIPNDIDGSSTIILGHPSIISYISMMLYDKDLGDYGYSIEVSMDGHEWVRVLDYSDYICRSIQRLWIHPRPVMYIRIVGIKTNWRILEISYKAAEMYGVVIENGLVAPKSNVALWSMNATVIKGQNFFNSLLVGCYEDYARYDRYVWHWLGSGCILVQLAQPYMLSSMRLLLWGGDDQFYKYTIEGSVNNRDWKKIVDKTKELTHSWQVLKFKPRPIVFIRITGAYNSAGDDFRCVFLEAPAQVPLHSNVVEDDRVVTNYRGNETHSAAQTPVV